MKENEGIFLEMKEIFSQKSLFFFLKHCFSFPSFSKIKMKEMKEKKEMKFPSF